MKNPASLLHDQLAEIVTDMVQMLYGTEQNDGSWTYAADKEWSGGDVCEAAAGLLDRFGLLPQVEGSGEAMQPATPPLDVCQSADDPQGYTLNLDGPLFRRQRKFLVNLMNRSRGNEATPLQLPADAEEVLEGLISLTDEIADQAHDQYGIDCLLEEGASPKEVAAPRYILYDFDSGDLATTTVYDSYDEAADDASQLDNVIILALRLG